MITFLLSAVLLILGFLLYGRLTEKIFGPDGRETPAVAHGDGVDYVPMPTWKVFLIQLLNIAGTGPIFGALSGALFGPVVYLWNHFTNEHPDGISAWPFMFITVACGAISGFHSTQSPMMARCCKSEYAGRKVFYGAMIAEGLLALVWAAAGVTCYESRQALSAAGAGCSAVVYAICESTMGRIGSVLALLGVIVCPISSGDTAYRSARLVLADWFGLDQASFKNRLLLTVPLLLAGFLISRMDYSVLWRYFSWYNQALAMIGLWACSVYLMRQGRNWKLTLFPAGFMTAVTVSYFGMAGECLGKVWQALSVDPKVYSAVSVFAGIAVAVLFTALFLRKADREKTVLR